MRRAQLQHIILEIGERFGLTEFYVIGSAAILAFLPDPPEGALVATRDVDVIPSAGDEKVAKLGAGREKDLEFARAAIDGGIVQRDELIGRLDEVAADPSVRRLIEDRIQALFRDIRP